MTGINLAPRGVPQIEVTFNVDANGILNVSAKDKASGNEKQITCTNDIGHFSKEEIARLVKEGERNRVEDEKAQRKIEAKNELESYAYSLRSTLRDEKISGVLLEEDKQMVVEHVDETISWLERNQLAEVDEFEEKKRELEEKVIPIFSKIYGQGTSSHPPTGGSGMSNGNPFGGANGMPSNSSSSSEPKIEEVD